MSLEKEIKDLIINSLELEDVTPEDIKRAYENRLCPICNKKIKLNLELLEDW